MKTYRSALAAVLVGCSAAHPAAHAQMTGPGYHISGFGTAGVVHSNKLTADYVSSTFQPTGAGYTDQYSFKPDSAIGVQADIVVTDRLTGVIQVISKYRYDRTYRPEFEWANAKYRFTDDFSMRLGRIALPTFLYSETRLVSYPNLWARPPQEVYGTVTITHNDGIDAAYRKNFGGINNTLQAYYGNTVGKAPWGRFKSKNGVGLYNTIETSSLTLRAGISHSKLDIGVPVAEPSFNGLIAASALPGATGTQSAALAAKYRRNDIPITIFSAGATYDPGRWILAGEFVDFKGKSIMLDSKAWYASTGYRFGKLTPYLTFARVSTILPQESIDPTFPAVTILVAGLNSTLRAFSVNQHTTSLGLRWDMARNLAGKFQFDQVQTDESSPGRFINVQPSFESGKKVNITSVGLDFVF